jgi:riboflavin kinase
MLNKITVKGTLITGLGTGKLFMEKEGYKKAFQKSLNYTPWPGTFNLKLNSPVPKEITYKTIKGFKEGNKIFGNIKYHKCTIKNKNLIAHIIIPQKTEHNKNIIEIISPKHLRKVLNVMDGDNITVYIQNES